VLDLLVRYRKYSVLGVVVIAAVALLTAQQTRPGEGFWIAEGIAAVTAPVQTVFARVHRGAASLWAGYLDWKHLRAEVARLRAETVALRLRQLRQEALEVENTVSGIWPRSASGCPSGLSARRSWRATGTASPAASRSIAGAPTARSGSRPSS
jgi:hypothetical protein